MSHHYRVTGAADLRALWEAEVLRVPGFSFADYRLLDRSGALPPGCTAGAPDLTTDDTIIV